MPEIYLKQPGAFDKYVFADSACDTDSKNAWIFLLKDNIGVIINDILQKVSNG